MPNKPFYTITRDKRFKLVKPAIKELLSKPFSEVTVSSLSTTMGILRTDFYYYFKDKDDLVEAFIDNIYHYTKPRRDHLAHDLIIAIFKKIVKMEGIRNQKYLLDIVTNYHPEFIDHFFSEINKKAEREKMSVKEYLDEKIAFYKLLSVTKLYLEKKLTVEHAFKELETE